MSDVWESGEAVERMIAAGDAVMAEAIKAYKPVAIFAAFSGGDDSIVASHYAVTRHSAGVFNADTLVGLAPARAHIAAVADRFRWDLEVGKAVPNGPPKKMRDPEGKGKLVPFDPAVLPAGRWADGASSYEESVLNWGFPGRGKPQHAIMYQRLKEKPIRAMLKRFAATKSGKTPKVLLVSGIRHDESSIRAGYKRAHAAGNFGDVWVNPFYWNTAADFEAYRQEFGLPRNPVKRQCGISGECCCGTFSKTDERQAYRAVDPAFDGYLSTLERLARENGHPWGWGESPPKWVLAARRGQQFFDFDERRSFQPMCVGCTNGRR